MCGGSYGDNFGLALKTSGQLWSWGGNFRGQLGNADYVGVYSPTATTAGHVWAQVAAGSNAFGIDTDGKLWAWGDDEYGGLGLGDPTGYWSTTVYAIADIVDDVPAQRLRVGGRGVPDGLGTQGSGRLVAHSAHHQGHREGHRLRGLPGADLRQRRRELRRGTRR